jgi:hypothetical protein
LLQQAIVLCTEYFFKQRKHAYETRTILRDDFANKAKKILAKRLKIAAIS